MTQPILWQPQEGPQTDFCKSDIFEVLIGGAAGGGKSDVLLHESLRQINIPEYRAIIFRRTNPQLKKLIDRSNETFPQIGGKWNDYKKIWKFPSGAEAKLCHMEHEKNKLDHDGQEYHYIGFDELTHFTYTQYTYLYSRCRTSHPEIKCCIRASAMPMGAGITWVKQRFIDGGPYKKIIDEETGLERMFIPSKLEDNKILINNDPQYDARLKMMGFKLYKALRHGDWDCIEGAAFEELDKTIHMAKPHNPPEGATVWRAFDWGYAKPFSVGWYYENYDGLVVRFREWYGCIEGQPDKGLRMSPKEVAKGILDYEKDLQISYGVADPAMWSTDDDSPTIAEKMQAEGVFWEPAKNDRIQGKMQIHGRLRADDEGRPLLQVTEDCKHWWRTIPMLQCDERKPEDVDTKMEDHPYDETRYSLMSRPIVYKGGILLGDDTIMSNQEW